ncbi:PREDICTED: nicotinamide N-methyltransferase-like [Nanorana parkeri]|uniref:nicotinamide N-methyltransferase-like n=1 Tax=Nanorana parkeri TaxID=125878 RepID=UPI000854D7D8|nr:PREDICTED: nicotinamide N-methyltransferase-like [Nanorana parkeri]
MDSIPKKLYHIHRFNSRSHLEFYLSGKEDMVFGEDSLKFPMMNLHYVFSRGFICGNLLIDLTMGSVIHHLYSASNIFQDIIIMKFSEKCSMARRSSWQGDRAGAFSWNHTKTSVEELEGKSDQIQDKELNLKASIKHIVTCNLEEENLTHPLVLPLADCVISEGLLDVISKDEEDYMRNLEKVSNLLKIGGHLILFGLLNTTYITAGADRFHMMKYNESFVRSALSRLGFVIDYCAAQRRRNVSDLIDYSHIIFITAHKEK